VEAANRPGRTFVRAGTRPSCLGMVVGAAAIAHRRRIHFGEGSPLPTELYFRRPPSAADSRSVRSLWLRQALADDGLDTSPLGGDVRADVCIVGGGFTGLWTALALKADDPSLDVVLIEADLCGSGASGRNGGFVMSWWSKFSTLKKLCGSDEARRLAEASAEAIAAIMRFCADNGIDAGYHYDGWVWAATNSAQVGDWETTLQAAETSGVRPFERLSGEETAKRSHSPVHLAGVFEPTCATVQPARLARGLARVATQRGIRIFERSPVTRVSPGPKPVVRTPRGSVTAERVVLAVNAWAAELPDFNRSLVVVASDVIATPRIGERLAHIGWESGIAISDSRRLVNYYRRTDDGRVVFGKGGGTLGFRGRVGGAFDRSSPRTDEVAAQFHRLYPTLWDVPVEHSWRGPIDYSVTGLPSFTRVGGRHEVIAAAGFSGNGVGPSYVAGRILASMVRDADDEWASTGLRRHHGRALPPEPFRYLGGRAVRAAIARKEQAEDAGRRASRVIRFVAALDPTSFVDLGAEQQGSKRRPTASVGDAGTAALSANGAGPAGPPAPGEQVSAEKASA
jgi:putative aminophosphonate oxidoreductase